MSYKLNITYKNVKNIKISLDRKGEIKIVSPIGVSKKDILELLEDKKKWIQKQQIKILSNQKYDYAQYVLDHDDKVYFLGKEYTIKVVESKQNLIIEKISNLEFHLNQSVIGNREFKLQLLEEFYKDRADIIFNNLVAKYLKITNQEIQRVTIKKTKTCWGSCNHVKKTINLNFDLILRDIKSIEYVILHEIAHLTYPNHSREFYTYIESYMPDWKVREKRLK